MINILSDVPSWEELGRVLPTVWKTAYRATEVLKHNWDPGRGAPVYTVQGKYISRGWTNWTQGFLFGIPLMLFEATKDTKMLVDSKEAIRTYMYPHITHQGVHDHGFNNVSTYGNLLRLMSEGYIEENPWEREYYQLALRVSGIVQASRWTTRPGTTTNSNGFIYSFNGPHSLFADTIRSLRSLALAHQLGASILGEQEHSISLLDRLVAHGCTTAEYSVYYGQGRDIWDIRGRVAHESIFNTVNGSYRNPSSQQGYSPFSTWTRGLAWVVTGFSEILQWLHMVHPDHLINTMEPAGSNGTGVVIQHWLRAACATSDFYIEQSPPDGIPYWDTGAPSLQIINQYHDIPADPCNPAEPVDSSAAAIAAQGLLRLGNYLKTNQQPLSLIDLDIDGTGPKKHCATQLEQKGNTYRNAGLVIARTLFAPPYLSEDPDHQGILLHSIYHRPNGWDHVPQGKRTPCGESCLWGDYHIVELALMLERENKGLSAQNFYDIGKSPAMMHARS